ncbi:MAG: hypothetical protein ABEK04_05160, partial [Candidatus Nanohalobium sp.]
METQEGQQDLQETQKILGLEDDSIKTMAHVIQELRDDSQNVSNEINDIDSKIKELKQEAQSGNIDPQLAARVFA